MPIKWSALAVSEALDGIEQDLNLAQAFVDSALEKTSKAKQIPRLPGYIYDRLMGLEYDIENKWERIRGRITAIRENIPKEDLEAEKRTGKKLTLNL